MADAPLAVLFDVDGALVDSVDLHARAWREALARFGKDPPGQTTGPTPRGRKIL